MEVDKMYHISNICKNTHTTKITQVIGFDSYIMSDTGSNCSMSIHELLVDYH